MGKAREVSLHRASVPPASAGRPGANAQLDWSPWRRLSGLPSMSVDVLAETLDGGQAFRWNRLVTTDVTGAAAADRKSKTVATASSTGGESSPIWQGVWSSHVARIRLGADERVEWSAPTAFAASTATALESYFALDRDFSALADTLPWRSDPHLARGIVTFNGLRILRQPFGETLLGFLCSATKQIVQIKQMLALLAERHGAAIRPAPTAPPTSELSTLNPQPSTPLPHQLPTWPELASIPEADLRACLLGFRARYIAETARFLAAHPGWLEETEALPYAEAKERLCLLPGVGEKVADCVLLFGAGRLEAFPVDVWILKTLARRYGLEGWRTPQLAQFGRVHFGPLAGLAQQYLFAWERREARK